MEPEKEIGMILNSFQPALVLMTANQLRIFDSISSAPQSADQVALELKLSPKGTLRLLNALTSMGIVNKRNDEYQIEDAWKPYLTRGGDHNMQQWIQLVMDLVPVWTDLPLFIKDGSPIKSVMEMLGNDPANMRAFIDAMHDKGLKATWMIARELPIGEAKRMLDVGGGPGTYALEWAKLHPHLKATVFDIPPVVEVAKDYIQRYGLSDRIDVQAGDFTQDDLGNGYDLILLANVLHMYPEDQGRELVARAVNSLEPKGRLVIHGFCTDEGDIGPLNDVMFSLNMGLLTEGGRAHPVNEKIGWMEEAGLQDIRHFRIEAVPTGVLTGVKS